MKSTNVFASLTRGCKFSQRGPAQSGTKAKALQLDLLSVVAPSSSSSASGAKRKPNHLTSNENSEDDDEKGDDDEDEYSNNSDDDDDDDEEGDYARRSGAFKTEEAVNGFRNMMQIKVKGSQVPDPVATFVDMSISDEIKGTLLKNIEESSWKEPTAIQMQAIPCMLAGRDILAAAPTGSGKTGAYLIPVLSILSARSASSSSQNAKSNTRGIRSIILAPTRELAEQICREAKRLSSGRRIKVSLLKKSNAAQAMAQRNGEVFKGLDVLVATPMRLLYLSREGVIDLSSVQVVVLDEADKLFELTSGGRGASGGSDDEDDNNNSDDKPPDTRSSFLSQVDEILSKCTTPNLQRALFSATLGPFVMELAGGFLRDPVHVTVGKENTGAMSIDQRLTFCGSEEGKLLAMRQLIQQGLKPPVLLFVQSVDRAKALFKELVYDGINVEAIHAEKTQAQREDIIRQFRIGDIWVLICTDLMARGVDFKGVQMVINYDLPQSAVSYIHRIGRTGRAGRRGIAVTFFTEDDMPRLRSIANVMRQSGCRVPDWMLSIKQLSTMDKRFLKHHAPERGSRITKVSNTSFDTKMNKMQKNKKRRLERGKGERERERGRDRER